MDATVKKLFMELDRTGHTRKWASNLLGISESTISRWESRGSEPHDFIKGQMIKLLNKLAKENDHE